MVGGHLGSRWRGGKLGGQQVEGCREAWGQGCAGSWCRCACARAGGCNRGPAAPPGGGVPGLHSPCAHRHSLPPPPINPPLQPLTPPCPAPVLQNVPWCDAGGGGREVPVTRGVGREVLGPALARPGRRRGPHLALAAVEGGGACVGPAGRRPPPCSHCWLLAVCALLRSMARVARPCGAAAAALDDGHCVTSACAARCRA